MSVLGADALREQLRGNFAWTRGFADLSKWWLDPVVLASVGPALAELHTDANADIVVGIDALGFLLGPLTAVALRAGFVEVRKDLTEEAAGGPVLLRTTPPDYNERSLTLGMRRDAIKPGARALLVDDWIETGAQATATRRLVEDAGGRWVGVAALVDATTHDVRRALNVRALLRVKDLS